jgi:hypothetical protein
MGQAVAQENAGRARTHAHAQQRHRAGKGEIFQRACARGDEHWAVWIDWYEARLAGGGELSEKDEIARVSLPNEAWAQGPEFANPSISRLVV